MTTAILGQPTTLPFTAPVGMTSFPIIALLNGALLSPQPAVTFSVIGQGLYTLTFTPAQTGEYSIYVNSQILNVECQQQSLQTSLQTLADAALGSWSWNKSTGVLTLLTASGTTLATYNVTDSAQTTSRERTS
jgi:hypothetical protein